MSHKTLLTTFIGGEVSSKMQNRFDYEKYQSSARWIENWYITKEGNINFRTGTYYSATIPNMVNYAGTDRPARLFQWLRRDNLIFFTLF